MGGGVPHCRDFLCRLDGVALALNAADATDTEVLIGVLILQQKMSGKIISFAVIGWKLQSNGSVP